MITLSLRYYNCAIRLVLVLLVAIVVLPALLNAQQLDDRTTGRTYILAFPDTTANTFDERYPNKMEDKLYIYIYSAVNDNKVTVTGSGYSRVLTVQSGKFQALELTDPTSKAPQPIVTESGKPSRNVFRVEAEQPVIVYCYMVTKFGTEAWTPIAVEAWGKEYYAQAVPAEAANNESPAGENNYNAVRKMAPAELLVIASEDNTIVTVTPNSQLLNNPQTTGIKLNKNEAYQIQSFVDTTAGASRASQPDLAGTYITSNKPIGVLSGNTRTMVFDEVAGLAKNSFRDMTMEWLAPVEQHGTEFVYMPTMDARRATGAPGEKLSEKRTSELVRIYATDKNVGNTTGYLIDSTGTHVDFQLPAARTFKEFRVDVAEAHYIKTDTVAQAFMTTTAVVKFLGTTGSGNYIGAKYDGWSTYAVEMVPREQWINAAPYIAPTHPSSMEHKLNIVTDVAYANKIYWGPAGQTPTNPVVLNKVVRGTNYVWGDIAVPAGQDLWITGWDRTTNKQDPNVRFYGFVYGLDKGHEEYRPGKSERKDDGGDEIASGGGDEVLHPSEYAEALAVSYGYPLAPARVALNADDSLLIESTMCCCYKLQVVVTAVGSNPAGLRSVNLDMEDNTKVVFIDPTSSGEYNGTTKAIFDVVPIDPTKDANADVVIKDRTGKTWHIQYSYKAAVLDVVPNNPQLINFGEVVLNQPSEIKTITLTNSTSVDVTISDLRWVAGNQGFRIVAPTSLPITLKPGEQERVQVQITPTEQNRLYEDSLVVTSGCIEIRIKVQAETVQPVLGASDLSFGQLRRTQTATAQLRICNLGRGAITFENVSGDIITGLGSLFTISAAEMQKLRTTVLGPNECIDIAVVFVGLDQPGLYEAQAVVQSSAGMDTVKLSATVIDLPLGVESNVAAGTVITRVDPNPLHGTTRIEFSLANAAHATVEMFDITGQRVALLAEGAMQAGSHAVTWNAAGMPAGVYYCRLTAGAITTVRRIVVVR